ncbi:MAG: aminotransferase class I/II-fold pyridoxal phosphate-dependent enzyme [Peptococcaceae bacterium]|nr:aminotransferase class I/II-fold pyridoxal phosphate-dependent enzyme [Peptococcaceae bacterium]
MNQRRAPLFEALKRYRRKNRAGLHVPAHGQGRALPRALRALGGALVELDLTELPGLDDLHRPAGPIARSQALAAALYGADRSFFLVNGSTVGIQALLLAVLKPGDKILMPRHVHRSIINGLILCGAKPVYLPPVRDNDFGIPLGPKPADVIAALEAHPGVKALLAVHPNYYGVGGLSPEMVAAAHSRGIPVIVDEAHGAHLPFAEDLPEPALACGADACVQSTHKLGGAFTQASLLHLKGSRVPAGRVQNALSCLQTTSPSYLLMASLDVARRQLALRGPRMVRRALGLAQRARDNLCAFRRVEVLTPEYLPPWVPGYDGTKLTVSLREAGLSGHQTARLLHREYGVQVEMADAGNIVAVVGIGTASREVWRFVKAVTHLAAKNKANALDLPPEAPVPPQVLTPRQSWLAASRSVPLRDAAGYVAAETVSITPPGTPVLFPGEKIIPEMVEYINEMRRRNIPLHASDPSLETLRVVDG